MNGIYGADTITVIYIKLGFLSSILILFILKMHFGQTDIIRNVEKITEFIEVHWYFSNSSITQELKFNHKTVLNRLSRVEFKKQKTLGLDATLII